MKKLLTLICLLIASTSVKAADTTVVVSHQDVTILTNPIVGTTIYPMWAKFPTLGTPYRKVLMQLNFECAPGFKCGEWDYMNNIIVGRVGTKTANPLNYEIARLMTPFGFYWNSGMNWQHTWYYDVTDFAMLLHDSVEVIYRHTGDEPNNDRGWKINLKFICIKGTPSCEPVAMTRLWDGIYEYGNNNDSIEKHLIPVNVTLNNQTSRARFKAINTGHGSDSASGCLEYCRKYRQVKWDGNVVNTRDLWRNDCGANAVYPQSNTWVYDRGGWCPGSPVRYDDVDITGLTGGTQHSVDMDMEPYVAYKEYGNLNTSAYLIEYAAPANTNDVSIENIMAPSTEAEFKRLNPICGNPIIVIRNNGSATLTTAKIEYGLEGGNMTTYDWKGNLGLWQYDTVRLTNSVNWGSKNGKFVVTVKDPNGQADGYSDDNTMSSDFNGATTFPDKIIVHFMTNNDASENSYKIVNVSTGQIHFSKNNFRNQTLYLDTISLSPGACYQFYFSDEGQSTRSGGVNKDGLQFLSFYDLLEGTGTLRIKNANNGASLKDITALNAGPYGLSGGNFGAFYSLNFMSVFGLSTPNVEPVAAIEVFPNPASDKLYVNYTTSGNQGNIQLLDLQGRVLYTEAIANASGTAMINMASLVPGIYVVKVTTGNESHVERVVKR